MYTAWRLSASVINSKTLHEKITLREKLNICPILYGLFSVGTFNVIIFLIVYKFTQLKQKRILQ